MGKTLFPVGSIFFTTVNKNPGTFIGGTWIAWGSGRVPVGIDTSDSNFNTAEKTGGAKTVNLSHSHTVNSDAHTMGHTHTVNSHAHLQTMSNQDGILYYTTNSPYNRVVQYVTKGQAYALTKGDDNALISQDYTSSASPGTGNSSITNTGNSSPGTNSQLSSAQSVLQPYITCYMWKRTA